MAVAKTALITGASEGIGRAFAKKLALQGFSITAVARNEALLQSLMKELKGTHTYVLADLASVVGQQKIMQLFQEQHFDLLINNAGVGTSGGLLDVPLDRQLAMLHLNCEALVKLSYAYLQHAQMGDALINVSSTLAFLPLPSVGLYCATKAFVTSLSESLWFEQKSRGVYVMNLCPGVTTTRFRENAGGKVRHLPKGISQTPEEVVDVAIEELRRRAHPTIITGWKNFLFANLTRILPRSVVVLMMANMDE